MNVILFGATGMIGAGALIECLKDPTVTRVLAIVRRPTGRADPKLKELVHTDFFDYSAVEAELTGYDACLFCLGVASAGMSEADYRRVTVDVALAAGRVLTRLNPAMRLCFISGAGTQLNSRQMWARVKGEAERDMAALPWRSAHMFRPGMIEPLEGVKSGVPSYQRIYDWFGWALPTLKRGLPGLVTDTVVLGRALIRVARDGSPLAVLESRDINLVGA